MDLNERLSLYNQTKKMAEADLSGWDRRTIMGVQTAKQQAGKDLEGIRKSYNEGVAKVIAKVFLTGSPEKTAKFAAYAETEGAIIVDGAGLYRDLATPIEAMIDPRRRTFDTGHVVRLYQELSDFAQKNGIKEMPEPKVDNNDYNGGAPDFNTVVDIVRKSIRRTSEDDLNVLYLQNKILDKALDKETTKVTPVVIYGLSQDEIKNLSEKLFPGQPAVTASVDTVDVEDDKSMGTLVNVVSKRIMDAFAPQKKINPLQVVVE